MLKNESYLAILLTQYLKHLLLKILSKFGSYFRLAFFQTTLYIYFIVSSWDFLKKISKLTSTLHEERITIFSQLY